MFWKFINNLRSVKSEDDPDWVFEMIGAAVSDKMLKIGFWISWESHKSWPF